MRLIDADALFEAIRDAKWYDNADRDEVALDLVEAAPTITPEPIVYCADCKYAEEGIFKGNHKCPIMAAIVWSDDYCSYGERRNADAGVTCTTEPVIS